MMISNDDVIYYQWIMSCMLTIVIIIIHNKSYTISNVNVNKRSMKYDYHISHH